MNRERESGSDTMKRFYKTAAVQRDAEGHAVVLDGKTVRTPMRGVLRLPNAGLAEAVSGEWESQGETIDPGSMPLTSIANTAIDRIAAARDDMVAGLLRYAETDMLCYRADGPADLVARQGTIWQAILDWAAVDLDATLQVTTGVVPVPQSDEAVAKLRNVLRAYDDFRLAALSTAVSAMGSLILGLALAEGRLSAAEAFAAAQLEETYQNEFWGEDAEAVERRDNLKVDIDAAATVFRLLSA
jgi:chaperone required for assembly of F1-ATPase